MRLQQFSPPIQPEIVGALQAIGIKTDTDLLLSDDPTNIFRRLPSDVGINLLDFRRAVAEAVALASATPEYGEKILETEEQRQEEIYINDMTLGVPEVDALLGNFSPPRIIELSGESSSGKTGLALQLALRHLSRVDDSSVLWVDSTGDFSPERVSLMLEQMDGAPSSTILERLQVSMVFDIEAVHEVLETLRQSMGARSSYGGSPVTRLIVIDSITPLVGPMLSATSSQGHAIMTTFMRQLRAFADSFSLTIVVINTSTRILHSNPEAVFDITRKPALGPSFTFMTDETLWLSRCSGEEREGDEETNMHVAEVFRSRTTRSKMWARFKITKGLLVGV
ncbi:P-loop containing nucleoside triphosphate hydrolase protein [Trametes meyenii]|nr:P-loop containing nucleoside triphosphate hydrolase protein [Trametes meyenii]